MNKLILKHKAIDRERFGDPLGENPTNHLVQNFCGMHLGVNLRKAQNAGVRKFYKEVNETEGSCREYEPDDRFVHEFCKVIGKHGTPEYGHGFPDFLKSRILEGETNGDLITQYDDVQTIKLQRQVGSRYFVTASNAAKVYCLAPVAAEYLQNLSDRKALNKLEQELLNKLTNTSEMAQIKLDGLFYYHVYADLMMLIKSSDLSRT